VNWISRIKKLGENIRQNINKKFPSKKEQADSAWVSLLPRAHSAGYYI